MSGSVLVVGGAGYIGSHTCKALKAAGFEPVVVDNLSEGHDWAVKFGPLERGEAGDTEFMTSVIRKYKPVGLIHFAANAYVGESVSNPRKYIQNNVVAMHNLLSVCIDENVNNVIFSSSCATYGVPLRVPLDETHPQNPISPYGDSKLIGEKMLHWYSNAHPLRYVALRYFNASGADAEGEIGEVHDPETHLIPLVLQAALGSRPAINVFGTDYPTPDGTCQRDYIHVSDLGTAHVAALRYLMGGGASTQINLGSGKPYSVKEVIDTAAKVTGRQVPTVYGPRRDGDPPGLYANPIKAKEVLGWEAQHSSLENILETAYRWELKRAELGV
ncbi:MAG: UDP-glucose 4-epimerase GalE [Armatimonadetes bacterium Cent15-Ar3]|nr:MAG: UDP-glucose 4-epimerase GalE [Armatimonadetes bacterium Cent15-Ar3]